MSKIARIINWERHQHYKDRNPPWIKLHRDLLTSETWVSSDDASKALAIALMVLAAEHGNRIPANPRYIQRRAYLEKEPDLSGLVALQFIEIIEETDVASKPLASASKVLDQRTETETENREQKEEVSEANASGAIAPLPQPIDLKATVFNSGAALLVRKGMKSDRDARSLLGRLRSKYGDAPVIDALAALERASPSDVAPYLVEILEARYGQRNTLRGNRPDPSLDFLRQADADIEAERRSAADHRGIGAAIPAIRAN